ncbi:acetoacetate decarboxylase family protein [Streptomyces sp. ISL-44]|uniref:acetoacetate decarboxylase family protein n=1 Tax=Streptomyces sp. ISL-44 TaxID=2819184 RepID=UPI001BECEF50|nr:acetoacetate decarboxylase family protein [Streptomyces sp. ISL-44]MBT2543062.1 acetoacetate decarboxylase family protein [Streptomyces sp. ISL-44]
MTSPDPRHPAGQSTPFPPEPWHLNGDMYASLWRIRPQGLPRWPLPAETRPLIILGHCTLLTFWVDYRAPGTLAYREFLVALAVRHRRRTAATAVAAWVDDEQSLAGGHRLWGIPKQLGHFTFTTPSDANTPARTTHIHLGTEATPWAQATYRPAARIPIRPTITGRLIQQRQGETCVVPLKLAGSPSLAKTRLTCTPDGPLAFLNSHKPVLSLAIQGFRFTVGTTHTPT